jgi:hypothetical protein
LTKGHFNGDGKQILGAILQDDIKNDGIDDRVDDDDDDDDDDIPNGNGDEVSRFEGMHSVFYIMLRIF